MVLNGIAPSLMVALLERTDNVEGLMLYNIFRSNYLGNDFSQQYFIGFSAEIFICFLLNLSLSILLIFYSVILNYYFWLRKIGFGY